MHIELWSDFACPYCYIGEVRLRRVLRELGVEDKVSVELKSFELDPAASRSVQTTTPERFARKYGLSLEAAQRQIEHISQLGRAEGLDFNYASTNYSNMRDAHRLAKFGLAAGHAEIVDRLFAAYFTHNRDLADATVLVDIAASVGLSAQETRDMLASNRYADEVRQDEAEAARLGIHGVPYFLLDGQTAISGAQPVAVLRATLAGLLSSEEGRAAARAGHVCGPDGCRI
ncbi:MAG: DsbA family oxidoreductase [Desulfovibrio sp.]|nr:DsbA family oxidoreductase [Desulfovibrio sp.]